jgi:hypothetical protein
MAKLCQVVRCDPLARFPVSPPHRKSVTKWIAKNLTAVSMPVPNDFEIGPEQASHEPEFIFKTFDRGDSVYVTLLEENRDMIGHGTTGTDATILKIYVQQKICHFWLKTKLNCAKF